MRQAFDPQTKERKIVTHKDVMSYSAMIAGFGIFLAGLAYDTRMYGTATGIGIIAGGAVVCGLLAYLRSTKG